MRQRVDLLSWCVAQLAVAIGGRAWRNSPSSGDRPYSIGSGISTDIRTWARQESMLSCIISKMGGGRGATRVHRSQQRLTSGRTRMSDDQVSTRYFITS